MIQSSCDSAVNTSRAHTENWFWPVLWRYRWRLQRHWLTEAELFPEIVLSQDTTLTLQPCACRTVMFPFGGLKASSLSFAALALHFALHLKNTISCSRAPADVRRRLHFYVSRELKNCRDVKSSSSIIKSLWARAWRNWLKVSGAALNCLCYMYRSDIRSITASTDSCFCTLTHPNNHKFLPGNWNNIFWGLARFVCSLQIPRGWKWRN